MCLHEKEKKGHFAMGLEARDAGHVPRPKCFFFLAVKAGKTTKRERESQRQASRYSVEEVDQAHAIIF